MGFRSLFNSGKGSSETDRKGVRWIPLERKEQLKGITGRSDEVLQVIFKNSLTCGVSGMVRRSFETNLSIPEGKADLHMLHIQDNRELSDEVSRAFEIRHESPQLLLIKNGKVVHHASHGQISFVDLTEWV